MNSNIATTSAYIDLIRTRTPLPLGRLLRAYRMEAKFEMLSALRTASFALPFIIVPIAIYLLFGVVINGDVDQTSGLGAGVHNYLFSGFSAMAVMMPGIFIGVILATERDSGLLNLKRSLPQPPGATIIAKVLMSMGVSAIALTLVVVAALIAGKITLSSTQVATIWLVLVIGAIPFTAIGLLIGSLVSASAGPASGNLIFLPMLWLSGLFIPLPAFLKHWVVIWPAFHLNQLALGLAGVEQFTFIPPALAGAVLVGVTVICGGIAIRRLARVG